MSGIDQYMYLAYAESGNSTCARRNVGCVLILNGEILSVGYNGIFDDGKNTCSDRARKYYAEQNTYNSYNGYITSKTFKLVHNQWGKTEETHAEARAIGNALEKKTDIRNAEIYCTLSPCAACAHALIAAGVSKVIYGKLYNTDSSGIDILQENGVNVCLWEHPMRDTYNKLTKNYT
jgi:dCMP deaminase